MKLKFICCEVFFRMACLAASTSPNTVTFEFTPIKADTVSDELRAMIQAMIDRTEEEGDWDAIILGYGLCGNGTEGLRAKRLKMVIPRAHDCCTIFMGSADKFLEHFENRLGAEWSSHGYLERGSKYLGDTELGRRMGYDREYKDLAEQYGEENAKMIWETLHPTGADQKNIYIRVEPFESLGFFEKFTQMAREEAAETGAPRDMEVLEGSMRIIRKLVDGVWDDEFLVVEPGAEIEPSYDLRKVFV
jgi:hypothetical protein